MTDISTDAVKTAFGGMDTGGGVGFGVPVGAAGSGAPLADPDPILELHNDTIAKSKANIAAAEEMIKSLATDSPIRVRAEGVLKTYQESVETMVTHSARRVAQKLAAKQLVAVVLPLGNALRGLRETHDPSPTATLRSLIPQWEAEVIKCLDCVPNQNLYLKDLSPSLVTTFRTFEALKPVEGSSAPREITSEDVQAQAGPFQVLIDTVDKALEEVSALQENTQAPTAYEESLKSFQTAHKNYLLMCQDVKRVQMNHNLKARLGQNEPVKSVVMTDEVQAKTHLRLLEETSTKDLTPRVPNYRLAIETSPRVCGNCRFFKGDVGATGQCFAFDMQAQANYVCDAWQAMALTNVHTMVRNEKIPEDVPAAEPIDAPVDTPIGNPEAASNAMNNGKTVNSSEVAINTTDTTVIRAIEGNFKEGDKVYSKALRTYAVVQSIQEISGQTLYALKLINANGVAYGTGFTDISDLQMKGHTAKAQHSPRLIFDADAAKTQSELDQIIEATRGVWRTLNGVVEEHADLTKNPLRSKTTIIPLHTQLKTMLAEPLFLNVTTGPKRKYFRALQTAMVSIGAAHHVLFEAGKSIVTLRAKVGVSGDHTQENEIATRGQAQAYDRVKEALKQVQDALVLPSSTHGTEAPGLEVAAEQGANQQTETGGE